MRFPACTVAVSDKRTASAVRSVLLLEGISADGGEILVTDRADFGGFSSDPQIKGIVLLSRMRPEPENGIPVRYLRTPFAYADLTAAVRELFEITAGEGDGMTAVPDVSADESGGTEICGMKVSCGGKSTELTAKEMRLFQYLRSREGEVVTRQELLRDVWETDDDSTNVTDVYVSYLRRKLMPVFGRGVLLSVRGQGYILRLPE